MTAFRVDDGMYDHPKFDRISDAALGLWTRAGSWCGRYLNGGYVPADRVTKLGYAMADAEELVARGIWKRGRPPEMSTDCPVECPSDMSTGYHFHQWFEHQPTKDEVELNRERWREAKKRQRAKPKNKSDVSTGMSIGHVLVESRNGMDLSSESGNSSLPSETATPVPGEWTPHAQHVAFVSAFEASQATTPSMGGRRVGAFHAKVVRTAELQGTAPATLFAEALAAWLAKGLDETARRAPYACFDQAWGDLTAKGPKAPPPGAQGPYARPGRLPPTRGTTAEDFADAEPIEVQLERLRTVK